MKNKIKFKMLLVDAIAPKKNLATDLGYDLYASEDITLRIDEITMVSTGIAMQLPDWYGAIIKDRSSYASLGITTHAGVIDNGYNGEIKVLMRYIPSKKVMDYFKMSEEDKLLNKDKYSMLSPTSYTIKKGDKIAQFIITKIEHFETEVVDDLDETSRGDNGFGSSGK